MMNFPQLLSAQKKEVEEYRSITNEFITSQLDNIANIQGILLTGSVARGDARKGPYGLFVDLTFVVNNQNDINLTKMLGPSIEPYIPSHCVMYKKTGFAINIVTISELNDIRSSHESKIFAYNESIILLDKSKLLQSWKQNKFIITNEDIKRRSLEQYFRLDYLIGDYRLEKWLHREAWTQITYNCNQAHRMLL